MVRFTGGLLLFSAFAFAAPNERIPSLAPGRQQVLAPQVKKGSTPPRKLQGRFLHITDIHPDPFYKVHSAADGAHPCHSGPGDAGVLGAPMTECDTPLNFVNATFQWINDNLKDQIDFVIWTGDSARHDNDEDLPRSEKQVMDQNKMLVKKFVEVFGKDDNLDDPDPTNDFIVPIIPTFGNNDILPHNIFEPGPNIWTQRYASIWNKFIPEEQRHSFARGGWFFAEVIRNKLAVFSLNTIYFFDSNSAVDGCEIKSEPGYEHMEWLRVQLQLLRVRGMKAIITGHVPPARTDSKQGWDETCWQKYTLWMHQYRDVIVGSVYGHMNIDHFMIQDVREVKYDFLGRLDKSALLERHSANDTFSAESKSTYLNELRSGWSELPIPPSGISYSGFESQDDESEMKKKKKKKSKRSKKEKARQKFLKDIGGEYAERFSLALVSPSVVPNYYPTLRIVEYNISGIEDLSPGGDGDDTTVQSLPEDLDVFEDDGFGELFSDGSEDQTELHDLKKEKKGPKPPFKVPLSPPSTAPPGPAYSPQTFTFLSYTQYFANLTYFNMEYEKNQAQTKEGAGANRKFHTPVPPKDFKYELEYDTKTDKTYKIKDLTVRNFLNLAERMGHKDLDDEDKGGIDIGDGDGDGDDVVDIQKRDTKTVSNNELWHMFVKRAFVLTKTEDELEQGFG